MATIGIADYLPFKTSTHHQFQNLVLERLELKIIACAITPIETAVFIGRNYAALVVHRGPIIIRCNYLVIIDSIKCYLQVEHRIIIGVSEYRSPFHRSLYIRVALLHQSGDDNRHVLAQC